MSSYDKPGMAGVSRRTVAKGVAWAVPAIAVASVAPMVAASVIVPPPPTFDWTHGCATTGNQNEGCAGVSKGFQVQFTLTNQTGADLVFVVTDARAANGGAIPSTPNTPGVKGIYTDNGTQSNCTPQKGNSGLCSTADQHNPNAHVLVPNGTAAMKLWLVFNSLGAASSFVGQITFQWYDKATCNAVGAPVTQSQAVAISSNNCKS